MSKYLKFILLGLLAAFILWWFGRSLNWAEVRAALIQSDSRLIAAAVAITCVTYLIRAYRWRAFLAPLVPASPRELFAATTVGFGAVFLAGRAGEIVRPIFLLLRNRQVRPSASFVTIAVERIYDMTAVIVLFATNLLWFHAPVGNTVMWVRVRVAGVILLVAAAGGITGLVWFKRHASKVIPWIHERSDGCASSILRRAGRLVTDLLEQVEGALSVLVDARELVVTVGWTALLWLAITMASWLVLRAFGLPLGISGAVFVMGWALVGSLVPTPGGAAGAFHTAAAVGMILMGVAREQAAAASIVLHLVAFGPALFFGLYYFLRGDISLGQLRRFAASESPQEVIAHSSGT